jgi:hypothetical protein
MNNYAASSGRTFGGDNMITAQRDVFEASLCRFYRPRSVLGPLWSVFGQIWSVSGGIGSDLGRFCTTYASLVGFRPLCSVLSPLWSVKPTQVASKTSRCVLLLTLLVLMTNYELIQGPTCLAVIYTTMRPYVHKFDDPPH